MCCKDPDIEDFLHTKAIAFQTRRLCNVFLIVDEEEFSKGKIKIDAYFTLSAKSLIPSEKLSRSKIKDVSGFRDTEVLQFVLIGQLGKHIVDDDNKSNISGKEILKFAFDVIEESDAFIPCKCVLVECGDNEKVHKVYTDYGFKYFQDDGEHKQFVKVI